MGPQVFGQRRTLRRMCFQVAPLAIGLLLFDWSVSAEPLAPVHAQQPKPPGLAGKPSMVPVVEARKAWKSSFSADEDVSDSAAGLQVEQDAGADLLVSEEGGRLALASSFPLRIVLGGPDQSAPFSGLPEEVRVPPQIVKKYSVGRCVFTLRSGEYSLSTWRAAENNEFWVERDAVLAESTFKVESDRGLLINISTEIRLEIAEDAIQECEARLGGRRILLGSARLGAGDVQLSGGSQPAMVKEVQPAEGKKLWLNWRSPKRGPFVEDDVAWPALVESGIFEIRPPSPGVFHLIVKPSMVIEKRGAKLKAQGSAH